MRPPTIRRPSWRALTALQVVGLVVVVAVLAGIGIAVLGGDDDARPPIRVAAAGGGEQQVLAEIVVEALRTADIPAVLMTEPGDILDARAAVRTGLADLYLDYTGSAWTRALGRALPLSRPDDSFEAVQAADRANEMVWVSPTEANATLALFVRAAERPEGDAGSITWLAGQLAGEQEGLCADPDFLERPSGLGALAEAYAISTDLLQTVPLPEDEAMAAVADGTCVAGLATATSPVAAVLDLAAVVDDQRVFPAFVVAPVLRQGGRADTADVRAVLARTMPTITTEVLAQLNAAVAGGEDPADVARLHLTGP